MKIEQRMSVAKTSGVTRECRIINECVRRGCSVDSGEHERKRTDLGGLDVL